MRLNEYQSEANRTAVDMRLEVCALGLSGESGEVADIIKKFVAHGHELEVQKLIEEAGDVLWYLAALASRLGTTLELIAASNLRKLERRYPDGFSEERSRNREE